MAQYLLDTNILLRLSNTDDKRHKLVRETLARLIIQGDDCMLTAQVLIEFWVVATRPVEVNGLGWSTVDTKDAVDQLLRQFPLLDEPPTILPTWLALVSKNDIKGKRVHDIRLLAVMLTQQVSHLLTLNPDDFDIEAGLTIVCPK